MLVSQLIYTGCGKDKSGAFSVWSKSRDISSTEDKEIQTAMMYKRPPELPSEASSQAELDANYPRKLAYFKLSSGRFCLAQSVYIGKVYSDLDQRTGNYIIHAFVFDSPGDMIPINYFGSDVFKRFLTYAEWHDSDAPEALPQIELDRPPLPISKQEIDSFFNQDRLSKLKMLVQAVINAKESGQKVTFFDKDENLKYWYRAMIICLPKNYHSEITFSTYYTPKFTNTSQPGALDTEVMVRNISSSVVSTVFSYQQEARKGKLAFDFDANIFPEIKISAYVDGVVSMLGTNLLGALKMVSSAESITAKCGCDPDMALNVYALLSGDIVKVGELGLLCTLSDMIAKYYPEKLNETADLIYRYGFATGKWEMNSQSVKLFRLVFDKSALADKNLLIEKYVSNQAAFGVNEKQSPDAYFNELSSKAPFAWSAFTEYVLRPGVLDAYIKNNSYSFNRIYVIFRSFTEALGTVMNNQDRKNIFSRFFVNEASKLIKASDQSNLSVLVSCISKQGDKWGSWLIENSITSLCSGTKLSSVCDVNFIIALAERTNDARITALVFTKLISELGGNDDFVKLYSAKAQSNPMFYKALEASLANDPAFCALKESTELYALSTATNLTKAQLEEAYLKFYKSSRDESQFFKMFDRYLTSCRENERIDECIYYFDEWFKYDRKAMIAMELLIKKIFSVDIKELRRYIVSQDGDKLAAFISTAENARLNIPGQYNAIIVGEEFKNINRDISRKSNKEKEEVKNTILQETFYEGLDTKQAKDTFVKLYFSDVVELYLLAASDENCDELFAKLFEPLYAIGNEFHIYFAQAVKGASEEKSLKFMMYSIIYASSKKDKNASFFKTGFESLLDDIGAKGRKKVFAYTETNIEKIKVVSKSSARQREVEKFVEECKDKHRGFFARLFGFGK